jgi:hypothetical protein
MHRRGLPAVLVALCFVVFAAPAFADNRVALVIGNGAYAHVPHLPNPSHDAEDVAAALKRTGFQTIVGIDLDQAGMQDAAIRFARAARAADVAMLPVWTMSSRTCSRPRISASWCSILAATIRSPINSNARSG